MERQKERTHEAFGRRQGAAHAELPSASPSEARWDAGEFTAMADSLPSLWRFWRSTRSVMKPVAGLIVSDGLLGLPCLPLRLGQEVSVQVRVIMLSRLSCHRN
jgi:hypothetical protein